MNKREVARDGKLIYSVVEFADGFKEGDEVLTPDNKKGHVQVIIWQYGVGTLITVRYLGGPNDMTPTVRSFRPGDLLNLTIEYERKAIL